MSWGLPVLPREVAVSMSKVRSWWGPQVVTDVMAVVIVVVSVVVVVVEVCLGPFRVLLVVEVVARSASHVEVLGTMDNTSFPF